MLGSQIGEPWHPHRASSAEHAGVQPAAARVSAVAHGGVDPDQCWPVGVVDPDVAFWQGLTLFLEALTLTILDPAASAVSSSLGCVS